MNTITVLPWNGGHANVTHSTPEPRGPMTKLDQRREGPWRYSADGQYAYLKEDRRWWVKHVPTDMWITEMAGYGLIGFATLADARRWTEADKPQPHTCTVCDTVHVEQDCPACFRDPHDDRDLDPVDYDR